MEYVYSAMWLIVGLILIFKMGRENKVFYIAGGFFIILGAWWLVNKLTPIDLFKGTWGWILRAITAVVLVILCICFYKGYRSETLAFKQQKKQEDEKK